MAVTRAVWGYITRRDLLLMRRVHRWRAPRYIRYWVLAMSRLGDGLLWYLLGLLLLCLGGPYGMHAVLVSGAAAVTAIGLFCTLKQLSRRRRPCEIEPHCWSLITPPDRFSFPSGHTMTAFAIALSLGHYYPDLLVGLLLVALSIAASRIILGMHFLTDVVVGALIGSVLGQASVWIVTALGRTS
jgi:undecaprenyl-diphosphatase